MKAINNLHPVIQVTYKTTLAVLLITPLLSFAYYTFEMFINHCVYGNCLLVSHSVFSILSWPILILFMEISAVFSIIWFATSSLGRNKKPSSPEPKQPPANTDHNPNITPNKKPYSYFRIMHSFDENQIKH